MSTIHGSLAILASLNARRVNRGLEVVSAATLALDLHSASEYVFTGADAKTVTLPARASMPVGWAVLIDNRGSGLVTVDGVTTVAQDRRSEIINDGTQWLVRGAAGDASNIAYVQGSNVYIQGSNVQAALDSAEQAIKDVDSVLGESLAVDKGHLGVFADVAAGAISDLADDSTVKEALEQLDSGKLSRQGGTMSGDINMDSNSITNLAAPVADGDAVNKKYVDDEIDALEELVTKGVIWQRSVKGLVDDETDLPAGAIGDRYAVNSFGAEGACIVEHDGVGFVVFADAVIGQAAPIFDGTTKNSIALFTGTEYELVYWESTVAGAGLRHNATDAMIIEIDPTLAGAGLSYAAGVLAVEVGAALSIVSDKIELVLDASSLEVNGSNELQVKLDPNGALQKGAAGVAVKLASDSGLEIDGANGLRLGRAHLASFNADSDWGSAAAGFYSITIAAATHGQGVRPNVEILDIDGNRTMVDELKFASNGDIIIRVPDVPNCRFAGSLKIAQARE